ncbi:RNA-binding domain-containing protein [Saccharata proteae CBS 121410]|uniref:RNA-binding domain-containing protein n=1 Tax=Saccharata proteae CBS 121410 TaxID=1314787 RepID=A0A9P4HSE9_9PEZI|nr:RNA-binding domain-containing protein [Saccharata proteae CBS 121410]
MAPELKNKKRKSGGAILSPNTKKIKKAETVTDTTADVKPAKKTKVTKEVEAPAGKPKASRKRASDFFDSKADAADNAQVEESAPTKPKKIKKTEEAATTESAVKEVKTKGKATKKVKAIETPSEEIAEAEVVVEEAPAEEESDAEEDDQTAALLKGFESSDDENEGEDQGLDVDKVPAIPIEKKTRKKLDKAAGGDTDLPGVVYIGRIPHGFYEHQMKAYFSQFGEITRLRLSRNKKTGRSKHYAFVEFKHSSVAQIVAETMDKYLMFGHILQVRNIPAEQVHANLFKGANRRFKPAPRNKMEGRALRLGKDRETWEKRITREEQRRKERESKLKDMGYEFEAPAVKSVETVPRKAKSSLPEAEADAPKALTDKPAAEEKDIKVKVTKPKKRESSGVTEESTAKETKAQKGKKRDSTGGAAVEKKSKATKGKDAPKTVKGKKA